MADEYQNRKGGEQDRAICGHKFHMMQIMRAQAGQQGAKRIAAHNPSIPEF